MQNGVNEKKKMQANVHVGSYKKDAMASLEAEQGVRFRIYIVSVPLL